MNGKVALVFIQFTASCLLVPPHEPVLNHQGRQPSVGGGLPAVHSNAHRIGVSYLVVSYFFTYF